MGVCPDRGKRWRGDKRPTRECGRLLSRADIRAHAHAHTHARAHTHTHTQVVLLGESSVGKSSLVLRFVRGQFVENSLPTVGAAFLTQTLHVEGKTLKLEIW